METAATSRLLTDAATVKASLGITDTSQDTQIASLIQRVSDEIASYLRIPTPDDNTPPTLGQETYVEVIRDLPSAYELFLSKRPITSVSSIVEDGTALTESTDFEVNSGFGTLTRLSSDTVSAWSFTKATITYTAGWVLPDDSENRNLPYDIEEAAIYTVSARINDLDATGGDMEVRSESLDGIYSASYETSGAKKYSAHQGLPQRAVALLGKYRVPMV